MNKIKPYTDSLFISEHDTVVYHNCCSFMTSEFSDLKSLIIPKEFFDNKDITLEKLQKFITDFTSLYDRTYAYKVSVVNSKELRFARSDEQGFSNLLYNNCSLISRKTKYSLEMHYSRGRSIIKSIHLENITAEEAFDVKKADEYLLTKLQFKHPVLATYSNNIMSIFNYDKDIILNKELKDFIQSYVNEKGAFISKNRIYRDSEVVDPFDGTDFYKIGLTALAFGYSNEDSSRLLTIRFILFNLLRIYQLGYDINIIKLFNVLRSKHPEVDCFKKIIYFLFTAQGMEKVSNEKVSDVSKKTSDWSNDFCILESFYYENTIEMINYGHGDLDITENSIEQSIISDDEYIAISKDRFDAILADLKINYTKKLLKELEWI